MPRDLNSDVYIFTRDLNLAVNRSSASLYGDTFMGQPVCKQNKSTGFKYANLILHDVALLKITQMPIVIHDSLLFKNIGDNAVDGILTIYSAIKGKQVFIAFDKKTSYKRTSQQILESKTILQLDDGGKALYGKSWAKRKDIS